MTRAEAEMWRPGAILVTTALLSRLKRKRCHKRVCCRACRGSEYIQLELRFWLSRSRWFWRGRRLLWLELADVTMGDMQDAKCDLSTLNLSCGR